MTAVGPAIARLRAIHPGVVLATLDVIGLVIAAYLSVVELQGELPYCGPLKGCEQVALSEYARIGGIPVAVFGVILSMALLVLAIAWTRSGRVELLAAHYGLSLVGVIFEIYFTYLELFVIGAVCIWCASYGVSLVARFGVALYVWRRRADPRAAMA
ncbi:MAG TPA: vitamin K epoxide reductase family protein [Candidatus Limnocylindrales bacterium]|jgi:uncharacterized membrane protein